MLQPVTEFADPSQWVTQRVWVETDFDTDGDGRNDRIHVDITRPESAERAGLRLPVIMESSPYAGGTNSPSRFLWNVQQELDQDPGARASRPDRPFNETPGHLGSGLARQWLARGFVIASSEQPGTGLSTGCPTVGDVYETNGPKFVIDWLNGRAKGYTTFDGLQEVSATAWTNGKVGMIGGSYLGTLPLSAAISGVEGLKALVPIAPNTSYYHYYRSNGLVRSPGGWLGEDIDFLYDFVHSGRSREVCDAKWRDGLFAQQRDRKTGDFNSFWEVRDQLPHVKNIKAAVMFAHGFNDYNVVPEHTVRMWEGLKNINPSAKLYMHQGGHGGGPPSDIVNKWWAHYLWDVDNGIEKTPRVMIVPSTAGRGGGGTVGTYYDDYPIPGSAPVTLHPVKGGNAVASLALAAPRNQGSETLIDDVAYSASALASAPTSQNRLLYALPALTDSLHISGTPRVTLRVAASKAAVNLSVYLVTLPFDSANIGTIVKRGVITRGWADPRNHRSLTAGGNFNSMTPEEPLVPGQFVTLTFDLQPDDQMILPGQQLAVMVFSSDREFTLWPRAGTELTVDLDGSSFTIPIVGGEAAVRRAAGIR
jgi:X-Pro dipeptidyl-peptidase